MEGPPLGPGGEDITWPDQVAPWGRKASSTRKIKPQTSNPLPACGASGVGRSPTPDCPPSGRAAGAHYPLAVGAGGRGRGDPSPTPQRALLRAGFARCGGGMRVPRQAPPAWVWGVRGRALSHPRLPALWAGCQGPLPTGCGCGGSGRGDPSPTPQRVLLRDGLARCGCGMRSPGAGASCLCVGRPGSGALPPPTARPLTGLPGPTTHWLWVRGGAGVATRHQPQSARSFELALRAVGATTGRPGGGGGGLLPECGASGAGRSPTPDCPPSGRAAGAHYPLAVGAGGCGRGDPSPTPQRALFRAGFARCGVARGRPGGGAFCLDVGRPGSGPLPPPTARPLGGLLGPTTHWLWVRGAAGSGTRHQRHSARSFELALRAVRAARGRPGGGASCLGVGRPGSGALPAPTPRPLGGLPGPTTHWL